MCDRIVGKKWNAKIPLDEFGEEGVQPLTCTLTNGGEPKVGPVIQNGEDEGKKDFQDSGKREVGKREFDE